MPVSVGRPQSASPASRNLAGKGARQEDGPQRRESAGTIVKPANLRKLSKTVSAASFAARLSLLKNAPIAQSAPALSKRRPRSATPQVVKTHAAQDRELQNLEGDITFLRRGEGIRSRDHLKLASQHFEVMPGLVDLGTVRLGDTAKATFTIQNTGTGPCRFKVMPVRDLSLVVKLGACATRIAAGMRETVSIEYTANRLGPVRLCLVIHAGELERFHLPVHGVVVEKIPDPFSHTDPDSLLAWIPRLPGTYFNWKTEELIVEHDSQTHFDAEISVAEIAARNERLRERQMKTLLPAYCVRVDEADIAHHEPTLEAEDGLDPGIKAYLAACSESAAHEEETPGSPAMRSSQTRNAGSQERNNKKTAARRKNGHSRKA